MTNPCRAPLERRLTIIAIVHFRWKDTEVGIRPSGPPSLVAGAAGLAPKADAGGHGTRLRAASTRERPQYPRKRPCRAATAASALGHNLPPAPFRAHRKSV